MLALLQQAPGLLAEVEVVRGVPRCEALCAGKGLSLVRWPARGGLRHPGRILVLPGDWPPTLPGQT